MQYYIFYIFFRKTSLLSKLSDNIFKKGSDTISFEIFFKNITIQNQCLLKIYKRNREVVSTQTTNIYIYQLNMVPNVQLLTLLEEVEELEKKLATKRAEVK